MFDLTDIISLEELEPWIKESINGLGEEVKMVLIGNKADLQEERAVTWEYAKEFADRYCMYYVEVSAKTGEGIQEALRIGTEATLTRFN